MRARLQVGRPVTDGDQGGSGVGWSLASRIRMLGRALPPLLALLSVGAALAMALDELPLALRLAVVGLVALTIWVTVAIAGTSTQPERGAAEWVAGTDPLTGLPGPGAFDDAFAAELERARAAGRSLALAIADVDALRAHEEWFGRDARDRALQRVAGDLEKWKRRIDVAAHLGGGEFALLLPDADARGALLVAERMRRAAHRSFAGERARPTLSVGVAVFPDHASDAASLADAARQALAAAKELGRDRSALFSDEVRRVLRSGGGRAAGTKELRLASVLALAETLDLRDHPDAAHAHTVAEIAESTALELGLGPERAERVHLAGMLHDVGMIGVSPSLLRSEEPLDEEGWASVRSHPLVAAQLLEGDELADVRAWVEAHHERLDGRGYPHGLKGDAIPLEARIVAVADAWEALTHERPYRPALDEQAARAELRAHAGTQFDPAVVDALLRALERAPATS
jgi:diguanylate cyclase (GGDEF)-like protein